MRSLLAAFAIVVAISAARLAAKRARARNSMGAGEPDEEELVAVITAAVAAARGDARGMEPGSFRIVGIAPSAGPGGRSCFAGRPGGAGLNTPVWGHVDRFARGE